MTIPSGAAAINPQIKFPVSKNISQLKNRTRQNVTTALRDEKYPTSSPPGWDGKKVKAGQIEGIDASKVTSGEFDEELTPTIGQIRDAIYQAFTGTGSTGVTTSQMKTAIITVLNDFEARIALLEGP